MVSSQGKTFSVTSCVQHDLFSVLVENEIWERWNISAIIELDWVPVSLTYRRHKCHILFTCIIWMANLNHWVKSWKMNVQIFFFLFSSCSVSPCSASFPSFYSSDNITLIPSTKYCFLSFCLPAIGFSHSSFSFFLPSPGVLGTTVGNSAGSWGSVPPLCSL